MKRVVIFILCVVLAISCSVSAFATESFSSASVSAIDAFINSEAFGGKNPQSHESRNTNAINSVTDVVNSDYWKKLVRSDRIAACQIPLELLDNLSTPELVQAVLDFPFFIDIFAFDSFDIGYACLLSECYALQTLITRADRAKVMLGIYEQATVVTRINSDDEARQFKNLSCSQRYLAWNHPIIWFRWALSI